MAEEKPEIDPVAEGKRIVAGYINSVGWAREIKRRIQAQLITAAEQDAKQRMADEQELLGEERFGQQVDAWRKDTSKTGRAVLKEILSELEARSDLPFIGSRMRDRIREELM